MKLRTSTLLLLAVVAALALLLTTGVSGEQLRVGRGRVLTHARDYSPPTRPRSILAFAAEQYDLIASGSDDHLFPAPPRNQLPHCSECQLLMQAAEWAAQDNGTMSVIEVVLSGLCSKIAPTSTACPAIAAKLVELAERIPAAMKHIGLYEPVRACSFLGMCSVSCCDDDVTPTQVSLGIGQNSTEMHVSWVTGGNQTDSVVVYGRDPNSLTQTAAGYGQTYTEGGWLGFIHRAVMVDLDQGAQYFYRVGGSVASETYNFTTWSDKALEVPFVLAVEGDMAINDNDWSPLNIAYLNAASQAGDIQAVIHVGDVSYADGYQASWDAFFTALQPTMTTVPYQVVPGNHELLFNFTAIKRRFFGTGLGAEPVPNDDEPALSGRSNTNLWSSYDIGCVHFLALMSENNFNTAWFGDNQLAWLEADLAATRVRMESAANARVGLPTDATCSVSAPTFIVAYLHRPLYCSNDDSSNCFGPQASLLQSKLEALFMKYGVSIVFAGHMHDMERSVPTYQSAPNAAGPIYVVHGAGGNREGISSNWATAPSWSAIRASVVGVGQLTIHNSTTLQWSFFKQDNSTVHTSPLDAITEIDRVYMSSRDWTTEARIERERSLELLTADVGQDADEEDVIEDDEGKFVGLGDAAWFFSPYNWASEVPFTPSASGYIQTNAPGAYIKVAFTGSSFALKLNQSNTPDSNFMTLRWSVDDADWQSAFLPKGLAADGETLQIASGLGNGTHTLVLFVLNSIARVPRFAAPQNLLRICGAWVNSTADSLQAHPQVYSRSLLVYSDNIGEGVRINGKSLPSAANDLTDNGSIRSWIQALGESMQAEVGAVSYAYQGWLARGSFWPLMSPDDLPANQAWSLYSQDSSRLQNGLLTPVPDYVLINHGSNDQSAPTGQVQIAAFSWLKAMRIAAGPSAAVFLTAPFGQFHREALHNAYLAYQQSQDAHTYFLDLGEYGAQNGLVAGARGGRFTADGQHPLAWRAAQLGGMLSSEMQLLLGGHATKRSLALTSLQRQKSNTKRPRTKVLVSE